MDVASYIGVRESRERLFLRKKFREYYEKNISQPSELAKREFGFGFEDKIDLRHKSFSSLNEFSEYVLREVPFYVSYSAAYYEFPDARPMGKKNFLGSDLVFDLDKIYLNEQHEHNEVLCNYCLTRASQDALRLVEEFLEKEFGFSKQEISANYSGQKGFHIHLESNAVKQLSQEARRQLINYIAGELELKKVLARIGRERVLRGPSKRSLGWRKKFFQAAKELIESASLESLAAHGVAKSKALKILDARQRISSLLDAGNWDALHGVERIWVNLFSRVLEENRVELDKQVTLDAARLIRLQNSLHGDTGLIAKKLSLQELAGFEASNAVAFGASPVSIVLEKSFEIDYGGQYYELSAGNNVAPESLAVLLICKKKALLA